MELLDLWCGCLSWRKLAQHVRWLPKSAALFESTRAVVRPESTAAPLTGAELTKAVLQTEWSTERWSLFRIEHLLTQMLWQNGGNPDAPKPELPPSPGDLVTVTVGVDISGREIPVWDSTEAQTALAWMYAQPVS